LRGWLEDETWKWLQFSGAVGRDRAMPVKPSLKAVSEVPALSLQGPHCFSQGYPQGLYLTCTDVQVEDLPNIPPYFLATEPGNQCDI